MGKAQMLLTTFGGVSFHFYSHSIDKNQSQGPPVGKGTGKVPRRKRRNVDIGDQFQ